MKLFRKDFEVWKDQIHILPNIEIIKNNMIYNGRNFAICFHWLVFHARLLWLESEV